MQNDEKIFLIIFLHKDERQMMFNNRKREREWWGREEEERVAKMRHLIYADWLGNFITEFISIGWKTQQQQQQTIGKDVAKNYHMVPFLSLSFDLIDEQWQAGIWKAFKFT
jgi:hypothetical protein